MTLNGDPRTTNALEAWHRGFHLLVAADHPTMWRFLHSLKQQLVLSSTKIEHASVGVQDSPRRKLQLHQHQNLEKIVKKYAIGDVVEYLTKIAHLFRFH